MPTALYRSPMPRTRCAIRTLVVAAWLFGPGMACQAEGLQPGDDFFAYANDEWLRSSEIPAGKARWNVMTELAELTRKRVDALLAESALQPPGTKARRIADFQAAYLDTAAIERAGIAPLKPALERIERIRDGKGLARFLGESLRADVDPLNWGVYEASQLFGLAVQEGNNGEAHNLAYLVQGGLGMPREHYLGAGADASALRARYVASIARQLATLRGEPPEAMATRAEAVMALETAIARSHATPEQSSNDHNADNLWMRDDFSRRAPGMDWNEFLAAAGLARQPGIIAWQPEALQGAAALVASTPIAVWKDYLRLRAVDRHADVLPRAFADEALAMRAALGKAPAAREQRAAEATRQAFTWEIGRLYVERFFPPAEKARIQRIVAAVVAALERRLDTVAWMSAASKTVARAKLASLYVGVGYPETWPDDSALVIDPARALDNQLQIDRRDRRRALAKLGKPVDRAEWAIAPHAVGAILLFQPNAYQFTAGLLQPTKFDPAASDAMNYGAIGAVMGHDAVHFIDTLGAEYELGGRNRRWWTNEDLLAYHAAAEALVTQYASYRPFADASVDGKLTLNENAADLAGLAAAFDAHRLALGTKLEDRAYVREQDRQFFIGYARAWRGKSRDEEQRRLLKGDTHAPERYRVATVRNIDAWYEAFDVRPGQALYLPPEARVRIW